MLPNAQENPETPTTMEGGGGGGGGGEEQEEEAKRLKSIAEAKFWGSNIKSALKYATRAHRLRPELDGVASMATALEVLLVASGAKPSSGLDKDSNFIDYYKVLQVEPFSHINTLKKQYKKLALVLHPDKSSFPGCEEAFKLVGEGFRVLSDRIRRKEYDVRLRIRLQETVEAGGGGAGDEEVETFWTVCSRCMLLHQFERRYLGHNLVCPSCRMSFEAVEVQGVDEKDGEGDDVGDVGVGVVRSERLRKKAGGRGGEVRDFGTRLEVSRGDLSDREGGGASCSMDDGVGADVGLQGMYGKHGGVGLRRRVGSSGEGGEADDISSEGEEVGGGEESDGGRLWSGRLRRKMSGVNEVLERSESKRGEVAEETMTLAEMQLLLKQKVKAGQENKKMKERPWIVGEKRKAIEKEKKENSSRKSRVSEILESEIPSKKRNLEVNKHGSLRNSSSRRFEKSSRLAPGDVEDMDPVESDFYDFGRDRMGKSFKKGQVWAIYDEDGDGMPRHYGLIEEVISVNPFQVKLCWLDLQSTVDVGLTRRDQMGLDSTCGRFKSGSKMLIKSLDIFSHVVDCERAAREVYRIYPRKGSVWAVHKEAAFAEDRGNSSAGEERSYNIVIFLTSYSEMHGLSMAYLEKVDGFDTVFKRQEIGSHAIRFLQKNGIHLISHQIPARKLSGDKATDLLKDCWELDPASLPRGLHPVGGGS